MANPFVISAKFTLDGSSVTASAGDIRAEFARLDTVLDSSARKAVELQTALDARTSSAGAVSAYQSTLQQIRVEQQLESQRLSAQTSEQGRAASINRLAQLARDAAAASTALARAEGEAAQAAQQVGVASASAAASVQQLADQQQRVAALQASGLNAQLGVRDDFGSAERGADIAAYGREMDELRARYNPLFALEQRRASTLAEITRAERLGAISAREMAEAVRMEEAAFARSVAAINNSTDALQRNQVMAANGVGQFATANVAAQFQDIAVTSVMGMNPLQIALQQGTQISAAFGNMGAAGAVRMLGSAFLSIISPVSLVTIGLVAGTAAAIQYFTGLANGAEDAEDRLEKHRKKLDELLEGYEDAKRAAEQQLSAAAKLPEASVASELGADRAESLEAYEALLARVSEKQAEFQGDVDQMRSIAGPTELTSEMQRILDAISAAGLSANTSAAEFDALDTSLTQFKIGGFDVDISYIAEEMLRLIREARAGKGEVDSLGASIHALPESVITTIRVQMEGFNEARADLLDLMPDFRSSYDRARDEAKAAFNDMRGSAPDAILREQAAKDYSAVLAGIDRQEAEAAAKKSARSSKEISDYDRQLQTIRDRTAAQQVETNVIGLGTYASERARMVLELENAARKDSIGISATRAAQIQEEASAYAMAAASQEKAVEAQRLADEQLNFGRETFRGFFSDLKAGLKDGQDEWAALGTAGANALDRIADRALGMAADGIFDLIFGAVMGGITGGFGGNPLSLGAGGPGFLGGGASAWGSFDTGGWTGGVAGQARGVVHGEEFVVRAGPAAQHRGLLERLNAGGSAQLGAGAGAGGGVVYAPVSNFHLGNDASRADFKAMLDERDRRIYAELPGVFADAQRRALRGAA